MDDIDRANHHAARMLAAQLANQVGKGHYQVGKGHYQGESLQQCEECDDPIPELRRQHMPGVRLCVPCQTRLEQLAR